MPTDPSTLEALGLSLVLDFITSEEEQALLPKLLVPLTVTYRESNGRSTIQRYGDSSAYNNYMVSAVIPEHFAVLGARLVEQGLMSYFPDSVTVNEYQPGDVIPAHIDAPKAGRVITVLSLGSPATMVFALKGTNTKHSVTLPPRSLAQMRDDIRYTWTHEILPVPAQRYSVVFRCSQDALH
jgi:alkylated DNA repair protein alkB family protein 8